MEVDLVTLKEFVDLGGIFILAVILIYVIVKKLDQMDDRLVKILTLLTVLVRANTGFNHTKNVLGKDQAEVDKKLNGGLG